MTEKESIVPARGLNKKIKSNDGKGKWGFAYAMKNITLKNQCIETCTFPVEQTLTPVPSGQCNGIWKGKIGGTTITLVAFGTTLYKYINGTLTSLYTSFHSSKTLDFTTFNDLLIMCNDSDKVTEYNGIAVTQTTFTEDGDSLWNDARPLGAEIFSNRIHYAVTVNNNPFDYTPRPGSHNNFDNSTSEVDILSLSSGKGDVLKGLKTITKDLMAIYFDKSIKRLSGSQPFSDTAADPHRIRPISDDIGCVAKNAIISTGVDHFFLSNVGLQSLITTDTYGDLKPSNVFDPILIEISQYLKTETFNSGAFALWDEINQKIYVFLKRTNNKTVRYGYDVITGDIEKAEFTQNFTYGAMIDNKMWVGDDSGKLYVFNTPTFTNTDKEFETHWIYTKYGPGRLKHWTWLFLIVETDTSLANFNIKWKHFKNGAEDSNWTTKTKTVPSGSVLGSFVIGTSKLGEPGRKLIKIKNLGKSNGIKLKFHNNTNGEHFRIIDAKLYSEPFGLVV
ncbi:MAG: hypothetical protein U9P90_02315 [Patescibacteria group bacterium]|nr:hypothetical protein [Patescibacteria group bacterium]